MKSINPYDKYTRRNLNQGRVLTAIVLLVGMFLVIYCLIQSLGGF